MARAAFASIAKPSASARLGQLEAAAVSLDESCADVLLERAHLLGDCGLGHMQFLRGAGKRQMPRDGLEGAQRIKGRKPIEKAHRLVLLSHRTSRNDLPRRAVRLHKLTKRAQKARGIG
jgi:hypothetical protein